MAKGLTFYTHPSKKAQQAHLDELTWAQVGWKRRGHVAGFAPYKTGNARRPFGVVAWRGPKPADLRDSIAKKVVEQAGKYKGVSLQKYKTKAKKSATKSNKKSGVKLSGRTGRSSKRPTKEAIVRQATAVYKALERLDRRKSKHT
jgi:hypothetical protein